MDAILRTGNSSSQLDIGRDREPDSVIDVRVRTSPFHLATKCLAAVNPGSFWWRHPRLQECWLEVRSCYQRIRAVRKQGPIYPLDMGTQYLNGKDRCVAVNTLTQDRILDMQQEFQQHQSPSPFAVRAYMTGWNRGLEYSARTDPSHKNVE